MRKYAIDTVLRFRLPHRPGQLARVAQVLAEERAVIGEITTVKLGEGFSVRDITAETLDEAHAARVVARARTIEGVELLETHDRVFDARRRQLHSTSRVELRQLSDLRYIYTPGVARVSRAIADDPSRAWELTTLGRSVAICTNGTRVLGLGDIGPIASLPVMEGNLRARAITPEMLVAAAEAIAAQADADEVVPSPLKPGVHEAITHAVAERARAQGLVGTAKL